MNEDTRDPLQALWSHVGEFLFRFAEAELSLNGVIKAALDLDNPKGVFIVSQFDLVKKIELTLLAVEASDVQHSSAHEWAEVAEKSVRGFFELNDVRVAMAHRPFRPDGDGGLIFDMSETRSKKPPNSVTGTQLYAYCDRLNALKGELDRLASEVRSVFKDGVPPARSDWTYIVGRVSGGTGPVPFEGM